MKTLILTCNTGEGHNSVSAAVKESFDQCGFVCEIADALSFVSEKTSEFICNWHSRIYRYIPDAFRNGYRFAEEHPSVFEEQSVVYKLITSASDKLYEFVTAGAYDCLICPHVISALLTTDMLRKNPGLSIKTCFITTDYTCSPITNESNLDAYFIPSEALKKDFLENGIPEEKLRVISGIPVRHAFLERAEQAKKAVGIREDEKHLLMMCGSMGCGPIPELVEELMARKSEKMILTVICGTNKKLYDRLCRKWRRAEGIRILSFVKNISILMDSADLYLTKPGGISTAEAECKGLPMVFVDAVAGCEAYNMQHFLEKGAAVTADTAAGLAEVCVSLLLDDGRRTAMQAHMNVGKNAADEICAYLTGASV